MEYRAWKNRAARFLTAQTISLFGSSIVQYAIVWYITLTTSSGRMLTLSTVCGFLPQILVSLFGGVWADRYDRKRLILLSDGVIACSTLLLALAFCSGRGNVWLLLAVSAVRSAGAGVQTPAVSAILPQIVPAEHLMKVNGINTTLSSVTMFLSPAVSGALLSVFPLESTLFLDVLTAAAGIGITAAIPIRAYERTAPAPRSHWPELRRGFLYVKGSPFIRNLLLFQLLVLFLISPSAFLTPLLVSRTFGPEVWRLTVGEMTYSLGMIAGGLLITAWGGFREKLRTTLLAGGCYGLLMLGLGLAPVFPVYLICNTLIGITSPCYNTPITSTIQEQVPADMQGRVFSLMQIASSCALPLGMVCFGPLADLVPVQSLLLVSGCLVAAASLAVYGSGALHPRKSD